jgi:dCTP diphosphatase
MTDLIDVNHLKKLQRDFAQVREWEKFHTPKNLAMALAAESGELLELFQWLTEEESMNAHNQAEIKERTGEELADIILYLVRIADLMQINLQEAVMSKMVSNNIKYPAKHVKGSAKKYDEYFTD